MRRIVRHATLVLALAALWLWPANASAKKIAVIIGNGAYQNVPRLINPANDANDVAAAFERLGFTVHKLIDARYEEMRRALLLLGREARQAEMAVLYFSGHGMEMGGQNWLIPVDAELRADNDVENESIGLNAVVGQVASASKLGLVILDACRNNPFAAKMTLATRTRAVARGLARTEPVENVLVAYAAKDGTTASDGDGRNSPFTKALLQNLEQPGLEITFMFRNVRDSVMEATRREQQPFVYGSLSREAIYLKSPPAAAFPAPPAAASPAPAAVPAPDETLWALIREADAPSVFEEFIRRFPESRHVADARARIDAIKKKIALASPPATPEMPKSLSPARQPTTGAELPQADGLFNAQDAERIAAIVQKHGLVMPLYRINRMQNLPEHLRRFVGVWASRVGYANGRGRQVMLIVTDVDEDGLARGLYSFGPPTPNSTPGPARTLNFNGKIEKDVLHFKFPQSENWARPAAGGALMMRTHVLRLNRRPTIVLEPIWRLIEREQAAKR